MVWHRVHPGVIPELTANLEHNKLTQLQHIIEVRTLHGLMNKMYGTKGLVVCYILS